MIDPEWLISQYLRKDQSRPLLIVTGDPAREFIGASTAFPNMSFLQAPNIPQYGTHHTKMMLLFYETGMRIVITTANLLPNDWQSKTQAIWISPLLHRKLHSVARDIDATRPPREGSGFKQDMWDYLAAYGLHDSKMKPVREQVMAHDFSAVKVRLIASVPGFHSLSNGGI